MITALVLAGWFYYDYFVKDTTNWQFVIILSVMAITKLGVILYYRITD